jgi:ribosomal protein S18 acetylase RimI-like enzyme
MSSHEWREARNTACPEEVVQHFNGLDPVFLEALRKRVELEPYAKKIVEFAERFEAWQSATLIGLVAMYANAPDRKIAFVTSVSVLPDWQGCGVAGALIERASDFAVARGFESLRLEVVRSNARAIARYEKLGFCVTEVSGEACQMDLKL